MNHTEPVPLAVSLIVATGLMGWVVWTQRPVDPVEVAEAPLPMNGAVSPPEPELVAVDESRVAELRAVAERAPEDVQVRIDLGDLYFDARRFEEAVPWYEAVVALDPEEVEVSTDLGVAYYYLDDTDRALAQFARSLDVDPTHAKTILSLGIVRAFGAQDLEGAIEAWEEVVRLAPDGPEGLAAADALERFRAVH